MIAPATFRNPDGTFAPGNPGKAKGVRPRRTIMRDAMTVLGNAARDPAAARRVLDALQPPPPSGHKPTDPNQ